MAGKRTHFGASMSGAPAARQVKPPRQFYDEWARPASWMNEPLGALRGNHKALQRPIILLPHNDGFGNNSELCETQSMQTAALKAELHRATHL
jgi:hypothetical protein